MKFATENLEINQVVECGVTKRNEKHYINVRCVHTKAKFERYSLKFEKDSAIPIFYNTINHAINANWKLLFMENEPQFKETLSEIAQAIITPIFKKIAVQDFFLDNYTNKSRRCY